MTGTIFMSKEKSMEVEGQGDIVGLSLEQVKELMDQRDQKWNEVTKALAKSIDGDRQVMTDMERVLKTVTPRRSVEPPVGGSTFPDEIQRLSDRILLLEAQMRSLQNRVAELEEKVDLRDDSVPSWKSDMQSLCRKMDGLRDEQKRFGRLFGKPSPYSNEGLVGHGEVTRPKDLLLTTRARSDAFQGLKGKNRWPWPEEMSLLLGDWLVGRRVWGHGEWLELLGLLAQHGFSEYAAVEHQGEIGQFLELYRP